MGWCKVVHCFLFISCSVCAIIFKFWRVYVLWWEKICEVSPRVVQTSEWITEIFYLVSVCLLTFRTPILSSLCFQTRALSNHLTYQLTMNEPPQQRPKQGSRQIVSCDKCIIVFVSSSSMCQSLVFVNWILHFYSVASFKRVCWACRWVDAVLCLQTENELHHWGCSFVCWWIVQHFKLFAQIKTFRRCLLQKLQNSCKEPKYTGVVQEQTTMQRNIWQHRTKREKKNTFGPEVCGHCSP